MKKYIRVADLNIELELKYERTAKQSNPYLVDDVVPDFRIVTDEKALETGKKNSPDLSYDELEYIYTGSVFNSRLLDYHGFMLHSSAVMVDDDVFLFSANPGVGKSTHTMLYLDYFADRAKIINDDKPALRLFDNQFYVYGTPWSGKNDISRNCRGKLKGIAFLKQGKENFIRRLTNKEAIFNILSQTLRGRGASRTSELLELINQLVSTYSIYELTCTISTEAVELSYQTLKEGKI